LKLGLRSPSMGVVSQRDPTRQGCKQIPSLAIQLEALPLITDPLKDERAEI
jgi:hypothetical protein